MRNKSAFNNGEPYTWRRVRTVRGQVWETCGSNAVRRSEPSLQNGDQDVKKTIMLTIGGCIAFIALSEALPLFFQ